MPQPISEFAIPIPDGLCLCGCGNKTELAPRNDKRRGSIKGKPQKYIQGHGGRGRARLYLKSGPNKCVQCGGRCMNKFCCARCINLHRWKNKHKNQVTCLYCGKSVNLIASRMRKQKRYFCNNDCYRSYGVSQRILRLEKIAAVKKTKKPKLEKHCKDCGKKILPVSTRCLRCARRNWSPEHAKAFLDASKLVHQRNRGKLPSVIQREGRFGSINRMYYTIGGRKILMRSTWEANYALYLQGLKEDGKIADWTYEPHTFYLGEWLGKPLFYTPDFKVDYSTSSSEYHEVKGPWTDRGLEQVKRMFLLCHQINFRLIERTCYHNILRRYVGDKAFKTKKSRDLKRMELAAS